MFIVAFNFLSLLFLPVLLEMKKGEPWRCVPGELMNLGFGKSSWNFMCSEWGKIQVIFPKLTFPLPLTLWKLRPQLSHIVKFPSKSPKIVLLALPSCQAAPVVSTGWFCCSVCRHRVLPWRHLGVSGISLVFLPCFLCLSPSELSFLRRCLHSSAPSHTWSVMPWLCGSCVCPAVPSLQGVPGCLHLNTPVFGVADTFLLILMDEGFIPGTSPTPDAKQPLGAPALPPPYLQSTRHQAVSPKIPEIQPTLDFPLSPFLPFSLCIFFLFPLREEVAEGFEAP